MPITEAQLALAGITSTVIVAGASLYWNRLSSREARLTERRIDAYSAVLTELQPLFHLSDDEGASPGSDVHDVSTAVSTCYRAALVAGEDVHRRILNVLNVLYELVAVREEGNAGIIRITPPRVEDPMAEELAEALNAMQDAMRREVQR